MDSLTIDSITMNTAPSAASTLAAPEAWFINFVTGNPGGESGPAVNEFTAMNYLAVYQCVSLIAGKIAELPLETYIDDGESQRPATERSERPLLLWEFNPSMSAMTARETGLAHLLTWGNSFTQIVRNRSGTKVLELIPLGPDCTKPRRVNGALVYDVFQRGSGEQIATLEADEVIHVPGLGFDGLMGYSPIRVAKTAIRSGMAQDREAEKFVTRGIRPPGAIKFPPGKRFKDEAAAIQFRDGFRKIHSNEEGAINVMVLEDGSEWQSLGVDPKSAQLLDSRKYSRKEICGIYRVPPFLIGDIESSTSWGTGVAQQMQNFVDYCLLTWMRRVEVELKRKLAKDDPNVCYRHCTEEMLRGDFASRTASLQILHQRGIITDNEWRCIEHRNPVEGGDVRHIPLNEVLIDETGEFLSLAADTGNQVTTPAPTDMTPETPPEPPEQPDSEDAQSKLADGLRRTILGAANRCLRREVAEARKAAERPDRWVSWVDEFYAKHSAMVRDMLSPPAEAWAAAFGGTADLAERHLARSKQELLDAADGPAAAFSGRVESLLARWEVERLADLATELRG